MGVVLKKVLYMRGKGLNLLPFYLPFLAEIVVQCLIVHLHIQYLLSSTTPFICSICDSVLIC